MNTPKIGDVLLGVEIHGRVNGLVKVAAARSGFIQLSVDLPVRLSLGEPFPRLRFHDNPVPALIVSFVGM